MTEATAHQRRWSDRFGHWLIRHPGALLLLPLLAALLCGGGGHFWLHQQRINQQQRQLNQQLQHRALELETVTSHGEAMGAIKLFGLTDLGLKKLLDSGAAAVAEVREDLAILRQLFAAEAAFIVDSQGIIRIYASHDGGNSEGRDVRFRPYYHQAMDGIATIYPAVGGRSGARGIYVSVPIHERAHTDSPIRGVLVLKQGMATIDRFLAGLTQTAALISPQGVIFASNRPDWLLTTSGELPPQVTADISASQQFSQGQPLPVGPPLLSHAGPVVTLSGEPYLYAETHLGWRDQHGAWRLVLLQPLPLTAAAGDLLLLFLLPALLAFLLLFGLRLRAGALRKGEEKLRQHQARFEATLDAAPEVVFSVDSQGKLVYWNPVAEIQLGYDSASQMGLSPLALLPADCDHDSLLYRALQGELILSSDSIEQPLLSRSGEAIAMEIVIASLVQDNGHHTIFFARDIRERQAQQQALIEARATAEEATRAKSMFLANMSHEIRTPMNAIIGMAHLALKTELSAKQRDYLSKIHNAGIALLGIINDILDFSKVEAGRMELERVEFRLDEVLANVSTVTGDKAHDKGLELLFHTASDVPATLNGDPLRLGQILINLINNAIKFTAYGEVALDVQLQQQVDGKVKLQFGVRDTGIGLSAEAQQRLFSAFAQADGSTTRKFGGTGLGLSICKRLVEMMGGEIWVDSAEGQGSHFCFTAWFDCGKPQAARSHQHPRLAQLRMLVVDDNAAAREILSEALSEFCPQVDAVASGPEALAALRSAAPHPYDLVLMDWQMHPLDGIATSRALIADSSISAKPKVVMVTAFGREELRQRAQEVGVEAFLVKPVNRSLLFDTLMNLFVGGSDAGSGLAPAGSAHYDFGGVAVLLAEDNNVNQQIACELLASVGIRVSVADNGLQAVKQIQEQPQQFRLVLMDLQMPEMDGFEATRAIHALPGCAQLPIIAMTAHAMVEERERCLSAGMLDHIAKPIDPDALFRTLARYLPCSHGTEATTASADTSLPQIPGIDSNSGLRRVAGNQPLYRKLLRQFAEHQADAPARMAKAERGEAERIAHSLKGVAANLGASTVADAAAALERAYHDGNEPAPLLATLEPALAAVIAAINSALPAVTASSSHDSPATAEQLVAIMRQLSVLLADSDGDALDYLQQQRAALSQLGQPAALAALTQALEAYDFDLALSIVSKMAATAGITMDEGTAATEQEHD